MSSLTRIGVLTWVCASLSGPAFAEDALDDDESASFIDDGEELGTEDEPGDVCGLDSPVIDAFLEWDTASGAEFTLPSAGLGYEWDVEYRVFGRGYESTWVDVDMGDETVDTVVSLSPPTAVLSAAEVSPLALTARATLQDSSGATGAFLPIHKLILDKTTGGLVYTKWKDHTWPAIPDGVGGFFDVADLDYDTITAIQNTAGTGGEVNVTFCVKVKIDLIDEDSPKVDPSIPSEDWFTDLTPKEARGHWLDARGPTTSNMATRLSDLATTSLPAGCGTLTLRKGKRYDIRLHADLDVRGQTAKVTRLKNTNNWFGITIAGYTAPQVDTQVNVVHPYPHQAWNTSAVTSWALHRRAVPGVDDAQMVTDESRCKNGITPCANGRRAYVYLTTQEKRAITHELGHVIAYFVDDKKKPNLSYDVVGASFCRSSTGSPWKHPSKEYASAAAVEGFADFYVAVAFNNTGHADCALNAYTTDFDGDGVNDTNLPVALHHVINCQGEPYWGFGDYDTWTPTSEDHLGDPCDGTKTNRGTAYDWMRFLWDLDDEPGVPFGKVLEAWDRANPKSWRDTDSGVNKEPWERFQDGGDDAGIGTQVSDEGQDNGVDRL